MSSPTRVHEPADWQEAWDHLDAVEAYLKTHASLPSSHEAVSSILTARAALTGLLRELPQNRHPSPLSRTH